MRHFFIDKYSGIDSYVHRIDPRVKILGVFALILSIILTPAQAFLSFVLFFSLIAALIVLSKIPVGFIFKRSLVVIPFVLMVTAFIPFLKEGEIAGGYSLGSLRLTVTYSGLMVFWNVMIKSYLCVLSMIVLMTSTRFSDFLKAMERLKVPRIFTMILSFMYRYIFVFEDELMKMRQAKESRSVGGPKHVHIKALAHMLGVLFIRAYERGEKIYLAMCSRGFTGEVHTISNFQIKRSDLYFIVIIAGVLTGIRLIGI
ncbi:MAG: cobalt ECF transporter T component CbiQ [Candidatus Omnitrophica bacterium]|nr:cobalt ECF transporter T component CbiQ [Candidatus Omnitrophota bacterium]